MTHICVNKLTIIGSDNGLSPGRRQAIIWTNDGILLIGPLGTNFSEILIEIHTFWNKKMHLKMSSAIWRPSCRGLNVLSHVGVVEIYWHCLPHQHDDIIKWKHFPRYWPFVRGIRRSAVNSPHKGQWRGALMLSLIYAWINNWVNKREAGDLRRHRAHYDVIVMTYAINTLTQYLRQKNYTRKSNSKCFVIFRNISKNSVVKSWSHCNVLVFYSFF